MSGLTCSRCGREDDGTLVRAAALWGGPWGLVGHYCFGCRAWLAGATPADLTDEAWDEADDEEYDDDE